MKCSCGHTVEKKIIIKPQPVCGAPEGNLGRAAKRGVILILHPLYKVSKKNSLHYGEIFIVHKVSQQKLGLRLLSLRPVRLLPLTPAGAGLGREGNTGVRKRPGRRRSPSHLWLLRTLRKTKRELGQTAAGLGTASESEDLGRNRRRGIGRGRKRRISPVTRAAVWLRLAVGKQLRK